MKRVHALSIALTLLLAACGDSVGTAGPVTTITDEPPATTATSVPAQPDTTAPDESTTTPTVPITTTTAPAPQPVRSIDVFFVLDAEAIAVPREIPATPAVAANTLEALLAGPTPEEADSGISTAIPADTLLLGVAVTDGLATVDLSREFEAGGGSFGMLSRLAQVVYTLTQFDTVDRVLFHLDGEPVTVFSGEGIVLEDPVDRSDYAELLPLRGSATPATAPGRWAQGDLPGVAGSPPARLRRVVLVTSDDVLNVRTAAGVDHPIVGMLEPTVTVALTGAREPVGSSVWAEIVTPSGTGWVNEHYLAAVVSPEAFAADAAARDLIDAAAAAMANRADLSLVTGRRGLYVWHHESPPFRYRAGELHGLLTDPTTRRWPSNAADLEEVTPRTFADAIADRFVPVVDDPDLTVRRNEPIEAGNGRIPSAAIPVEFRNFNYFALHDPGDDPDFGGLDWTTWYVAVDYENERPVIVGLIIDEWAP